MILKRLPLIIAIISISMGLSSQEYPDDKDLANEIINNQNNEDNQYNSLKSSTIYRLDSVIEKSYYDATGMFVNDKKNVFSFNNDNQVVLWKRYSTDPVTGDWVNYEKREYYFDQNGNETKYIFYVWDNSISSWMPQDKNERLFNAFNNITQQVDFDWDTTNSSWLPDLNKTYSYDTAQNKLEINYKRWNEASGTWDKYFKRLYAYDSENNLTERQVVSWSDYSDSYIYTSKYDYSYNSNNLMTQYKRYDGDTINNQWLLDSKTDYSYNTSGNISQQLYYKMESSWQPEAKTEYNYDNSQNLILTAGFSWDENANAWEPDEKTESVFDSYNNIIEEQWSYWDVTGNQTYYYKIERTYDNSVSFDELLIFNGFRYSNDALIKVQDAFNHKLSTEQSYVWDNTADSWKSDEFNDYYYAELTSGIDNKSSGNISVFPNPVSDMLNIVSDKNILDIKIINIEGKTLMSFNTDSATKQNVNLTNLQQGVYIVKILLDNGEFATRQISKH